MNQFLRTTCTLFALAGCGGMATTTRENAERAKDVQTEDPRTDEDIPVAPFCGGGEEVDYHALGKAIFDTIAPSSAPAYLALRYNVGGIPSPGLSEELALLAERGTLCGDAADVERCRSDYAALRPGIRLSLHHCYTRGDSLSCLQSVDDVLELLGQVDSLAEAFLVAEYAGYSLSCGSYYVLSRGKALADGSFQMVVGKRRRGGPCGQLHRVVVNVARDGSVRELESKLFDDGPACP